MIDKILLKKDIILALMLLPIACSMLSCWPTQETLVTDNVKYQSLRLNNPKNPKYPTGIDILTEYTINPDGILSVYVKNCSDQIMTIDLNRSFVLNSDDNSISLADNETRQITIASKGKKGLPKAVRISGIGSKVLPHIDYSSANMSYDNSICKFSVIISYSLDDGATYDQIKTELYVNAFITSKVKNHGLVNDALMDIYSLKSDAVTESWWMIQFNSNKSNDIYSENHTFVDYQ